VTKILFVFFFFDRVDLESKGSHHTVVVCEIGTVLHGI
jgi:hypothetical protein